jgi:hypothetical protein
MLTVGDFVTSPEFSAQVANIVDIIPFICPQYTGNLGGYICVLDQDGNVLVHAPLGKFPEEKGLKYKRLSREKADRLRSFPDHISSSQSREPNSEKYAGAVRLENGMIIGFSGLPEMWDEAVVTAIAHHLGEMGDDIVRAVIDNGNNPHIWLLVNRSRGRHYFRSSSPVLAN